MNNWYVVTGGPSTGKSTLLAELSQKGFKTLPEAARVVIDEGILSGKSIDQIRRDEKAFQHAVLQKKKEVESTHSNELLTFFDRGMHDTLAYLKLHGFEIEDWVEKAMSNAKYRSVFLLEPLPLYQKDYARTETAAESRKLNQLLYDAFTDYGMTPILVPVLSPTERADFVLQHVEQASKI